MLEAEQRSQHLFMPGIVAPRLELFRRPTGLLPETCERFSRTMRIEVREPRRRSVLIAARSSSQPAVDAMKSPLLQRSIG